MPSVLLKLQPSYCELYEYRKLLIIFAHKRSIAITGLVVLGGHTRVQDPHANFRNSFAGTSSNGNGLATALVKVNFAYAGFEVILHHLCIKLKTHNVQNSFNVLNEVKVGRETLYDDIPLTKHNRIL